MTFKEKIRLGAVIASACLATSSTSAPHKIWAKAMQPLLDEIWNSPPSQRRT